MNTIKPYNNRLKVEPITSSKKESSGFEVPSQFKKKEDRHHEEKYIHVKILDVSADQSMLRKSHFYSDAALGPQEVSWVDNVVGKNAVIETFAFETIEIDGEEHYFAPFQSVVCIY